jgi:hypothetical protein
MKVSGKELNARDVIRLVQLFVYRMRTVICSAHGQKEDLFHLHGLTYYFGFGINEFRENIHSF